MDIKEDEVKSIKKIGTLHNSEVKLITLKGGFHIGVGKKNKTSRKSEILAVGSHPALITHQIEKNYKNNFEQNMNKSEGELSEIVEDFSHNFNMSQTDVLGLDMYAIKKGEVVEFKITKHNFEIFSVQGEVGSEDLILTKTEKDNNKILQVYKSDLSKNLQKTIAEYAKNNNLKIKKNF